MKALGRRRRSTPDVGHDIMVFRDDLVAEPEEYVGSPVPSEKAVYAADHPKLLGEELARDLSELATKYDRLDHEYNHGKGTVIQEDCLAIRGIADNIRSR